MISKFVFLALCSMTIFAASSAGVKDKNLQAKKEIESNDESTIGSEIKINPTFEFKKVANEKSVDSNPGFQVNYPKVILYHGGVEILGKDDKPMSLKKDVELKERAVIKTKIDGQVAISLGLSRKFLVLNDSEVSLPSIGWETGEVPLVTLKSGSIFWQDFSTPEKGSGRGYDVALTSGLFQFIAPPADFILSYFPLLPRAEVRVVRGEMVFSAMNAERSVNLSAGDKVDFFGELEGREIEYDILLKGKKIPRGQLAEKTHFDVHDYLLKLIPDKPKEDPKVIEARRQRALQKKADETRTERFICIKPRGQLNQCLWRLEKGRCYRYRCNANGEWAEAQWVRPESLCKSSFDSKSALVNSVAKVSTCDY